MGARRGHDILSKRKVTSRLYINILLVARFLIPEYLASENGDCTIEVFLLITIVKLMGSFWLVFQRFGKVVGEDLKPGGVISIAQKVLEFQERLGQAPVESSSYLVEFW